MTKSLAIIEARLPCDPSAAKSYGIEPGQWRVLVESVWPSARSADAVFLALDYCRAQKLDPFKRPCHIVPMWNSTLRKEVETVWPGISSIRTTAARTSEYAGADETLFGEEITHKFEGKTHNGEHLSATVTFPSWAKVTVYRIIKGQRVPFPGPRVVWIETYSQMKGTPVPNARWQRAPVQMLEKCAEAAALRKAFPEELGSTYAAEEMEGRPVDETTVSSTDVRDEAKYIVLEMESCAEQDQLDAYWASQPVKEFLLRADAAVAGRGAVSHAQLVEQYYHQFRAKLPEKKVSKKTHIKSTDEYGGAGSGDAKEVVTDALPPSPAEPGMSKTAEHCLDKIDIAETAADVEEAKAFAKSKADELTDGEWAVIKKAAKAKETKMKEAA